MDEKEHTADYTNDTWMSLLDLLQGTDFLLTVDHSQLWRKHVAWSKPDGKDLRNYTAQRFSSSMVFLSLILAAEMNVLFNSSIITTDIRTEMINGNYRSVKHWIGFLILFSACVTVIALVSTFTAWGMVSAIGDKNAHCLLRSSIGQLVTSLPSNYVVLSLYLFLIWLVLFIVELTSGPMQIVLLLVVMFLFFQTVVSLSAFGRLILNTGAMGSRPVLDPELEKALLPSGLHASLLIKATHRKQKHTSVMSMYRTPKRKNRPADSSWSLSGDSYRSRESALSHSGFRKGSDTRQKGSYRSSTSPHSDDDIENGYRYSLPKNQNQSKDNYSPAYASAASTCSSTQQPSVTTDEENAIMEAVRAMNPNYVQTPHSDAGSISSFSNHPEKEHLLNEQMPGYGLNKTDSIPSLFHDSVTSHDFNESYGSLVSFPRASILNSSVNGSDLKKLVEDCCSTSSHRSSHDQQEGSNNNNETPLRRNGVGCRKVEKVRFSFCCAASSGDGGRQGSRQGSRRAIFAKDKPTSRRSLLNGFRQESTRVSIQEEWNEEVDVRDMYGLEPPAEVVFEDDDYDDDDESQPDSDSSDEPYAMDSSDVTMPHPSVLNKTRRFKSLRRLATGSSFESSDIESADKRHDSPPNSRGKSAQTSGVTRCDVESDEEEYDDSLVGESIHLLSSPAAEK